MPAKRAGDCDDVPFLIDFVFGHGEYARTKGQTARPHRYLIVMNYETTFVY